MAITGFPAYKPPVVEPVRCLCRRYYRVYVGSDDTQARLAASESVELGAVFVDARRCPWLKCECGQVLDFAPECSLMMM